MLSYDEAVEHLAIVARGLVEAEERLEEARGAWSQNASMLKEYEGDAGCTWYPSSVRVQTYEDDVRWHRTQLDAAAWMLAAVYDVRPSSAVADAAVEVARRGRAS